VVGILASTTLSIIEEINNAVKDSIIKRVTILGTKGGIGKSTLAFMLSKALASRGKSVMFIEGDLTNTISSTIGIKGDGFITNIVDDKDPYDTS
jgi:cellulose biosynthesis protein BcsQ